MDINFKDGKAVIKSGRTVIAKVFDRAVFFKVNNIKSTYSQKYPYSVEMSCGIVECESLQQCIELIEKYK